MLARLTLWAERPTSRSWRVTQASRRIGIGTHSEGNAARLRAGVCAVIHRDVGVAALRTRPAPPAEMTAEDFFPVVFRESPLRGSEAVPTLPSHQSPLVPGELAAAGYSDLCEDYADAIGAWGASSLLGHIPQPDWIGACGPSDRLLLQLSSNTKSDFQWGDCDNLYFTLPAEDLARGAFERVRVNCGLG